MVRQKRSGSERASAVTSGLRVDPRALSECAQRARERAVTVGDIVVAVGGLEVDAAEEQVLRVVRVGLCAAEVAARARLAAIRAVVPVVA